MERLRYSRRNGRGNSRLEEPTVELCSGGASYICKSQDHLQFRLDIEEHLYARSYVAYFRLVIFSFGFRQVFRAGIEAWYDYFFTKVRWQRFHLNRVSNVSHSASNTLNR